MKFTGHPFVDAGIAAAAAIIEETQKDRIINTPEELTLDDLIKAINLIKERYYFRLTKKKSNTKEKPLFYFLLQEILPGSPWDQVKTGNLVDLMKKKFNEFLKKTIDSLSQSPIGTCTITGLEAHVLAGKSEMPMLSSSDERPNCYPNLEDGIKVNAGVLLAILVAPIGIEKTLNDKGSGSLNLIYHIDNWRMRIAVAKRNLKRLNILLSSSSFESFWKEHYGVRKGSWRIGLLTLLHSLNDVNLANTAQTVIWSFNATNQGGRYENNEISDSFIRLHKKRLLYPSAYRELPRCSDEISRLILEGRSIVRSSLFYPDSNTKNHITDKMALIPGWPLQRLYAEEVLKMPVRLLTALEEAAAILSSNDGAVNYCLFEKINPIALARNYNLPSDILAIFADYPDVWKDYLKAGVLWKAKGNSFSEKATQTETPGQIEALIREVSGRMIGKHSPKRIAMMLSVRSIVEYRNRWIRLLRDGACGWNDFLNFNPLADTLSLSGNYFRTRLLRDYLIAYLFAVPQERTDNEEDLAETENDVVFETNDIKEEEQ